MATKGNVISDITQNREETAKSAYERMSSDRNMYITRAEDCAKYTIPSALDRKSVV